MSVELAVAVLRMAALFRVWETLVKKAIADWQTNQFDCVVHLSVLSR
jgi:hypothetical protein